MNYYKIYVSDPEDIPIIEDLMKNIFEKGEVGVLLAIIVTKTGWDVEIMMEDIAQLYLLGRYVGVERKRIHNLDY